MVPPQQAQFEFFSALSPFLANCPRLPLGRERGNQWEGDPRAGKQACYRSSMAHRCYRSTVTHCTLLDSESSQPVSTEPHIKRTGERENMRERERKKEREREKRKEKAREREWGKIDWSLRGGKGADGRGKGRERKQKNKTLNTQQKPSTATVFLFFFYFFYFFFCFGALPL